MTSDDLASVAERHSPFLRDAEVAESPALRQTLDAIGARCFIPIDHRGARIGFVTLGDLTTGPLDLDRDDLQRLESIAATASVMLENSRLVELATVGGPS